MSGKTTSQRTSFDTRRTRNERADSSPTWFASPDGPTMARTTDPSDGSSDGVQSTTITSRQRRRRGLSVGASSEGPSMRRAGPRERLVRSIASRSVSATAAASAAIELTTIGGGRSRGPPSREAMALVVVARLFDGDDTTLANRRRCRDEVRAGRRCRSTLPTTLTPAALANS